MQFSSWIVYVLLPYIDFMSSSLLRCVSVCSLSPDSCVSLSGAGQDRDKSPQQTSEQVQSNEREHSSSPKEKSQSHDHHEHKPDFALIPEDAEDLSVILDDRTSNIRQSSHEGDMFEGDMWSRGSSPRSMLSLSACWTQTTNNTFDNITTRGREESPLPFFDPQFDDDLVTSSLNSRSKQKSTLRNSVSPQKKVYMNAKLRAELSPATVQSNNSIISATPSLLTQVTVTSATSNSLFGGGGGVESSRSELNQAMMRGDSFSGMSLTSSPGTDGERGGGEERSSVQQQERNSHSDDSSGDAGVIVMPLAKSSAFCKGGKKNYTPSGCAHEGEREYISDTGPCSPTRGTSAINSNNLNLNSSLSTIHTTNTVTSFNTANTLQTLNLSTGTTDVIGPKTGHCGASILLVQTDGDQAMDSDIITPLSTATTTTSVLNRAFFSEADEPSLRGSNSNTLSRVQQPDASSSSVCFVDSAPSISNVLPKANKLLVSEHKGRSTGLLHQQLELNDSLKEVSSLMAFNEDSLPLLDNKPELLGGGSWDEEYASETQHEMQQHERLDLSIQEAFLKAGKCLCVVYFSFSVSLFF